MIPEHLQLTEKEEAYNIVGAIKTTSWSGHCYVDFVYGEIQGNAVVDFKGSYASIVPYLLAKYPDRYPGCRQIEREEHYQLRLRIWVCPNYVGNSVDMVLYLLKKHDRIRAPQEISKQLVTEFSFIHREGSCIYMDKPGKKKRGQSKRQDDTQQRIKEGRVRHSEVLWLYYALVDNVRDELGSNLRVVGKVYTRRTTSYIEGILSVGAVLVRLKGEMPSSRMERLRPYVPGLLKHKDKGYRVLGRWLKQNLPKGPSKKKAGRRPKCTYSKSSKISLQHRHARAKNLHAGLRLKKA